MKDRVCNQISATHTIQSCAFEFQPLVSSTVDYDVSSLLPTFEYPVTNDASRRVFQDAVVFLEDPVTEVNIKNCNVNTAEYLNVHRTDALWTRIPKSTANGVFKIGKGNDKSFTIQINQDRLPTYESIVNESGGAGVIRLSLTCPKAGTKQVLEGCLMFHLRLL